MQDGTFDVDGLVTHSLLKSLFLETLRFSVGAPSIRIVQETTELGGYTFHKGNIICIPTRELQMDAKVWYPGGILPDPSRFWAERFLDLERNKDREAERVVSLYPEYRDKVHFVVVDLNTVSQPQKELVSAYYRGYIPTLAIFDKQGQRVKGPLDGKLLWPGRHFAMYAMIAGLAIIFSTFDIEVDHVALRSNGMPTPQSGAIGAMGPDRKFIVRMRRKRV